MTPARALLTAGVAAVAALVTAPAAHAGWITGNHNPPVFSDDAPCRNGMHWDYATFMRDAPWPPPPPIATTLWGHAIVIAPPGSPFQDPPPAIDTVKFGTYTVPRTLLTLPPAFNQIAPGVFPLGPFGRRVNMFDFSAYFSFNFNRTLLPGMTLRMQWRHTLGGPLLQTLAYYRVAPCWIATVTRRYEITVLGTPDVDLRQLVISGHRLANGELVSPRTVRHEDADDDGDKDLVLVFDSVPCEPGDRAVLKPVGDRLEATGC